MKSPVLIIRIWWARAVLCLGVSACGCNSQAPDEAPVAFVLDVSGDWVCDGSQELIALGDSLPSRARIVRRNGRRSESKLVIALCTGETQTIDNDAVTLPARTKSNRWGRIWSLAKGRYQNEFVSAHARGTLSGSKLQEAVVRLEDGKLDLRPVFESMPAGLYLLQRDVNGQLIDLGAREWKLSQDSSVIVDAPSPGVHHLIVSAGEAANRGAGGGVLILVSPPEGFDRLANDYRLAVELTNTWPESVSRSTVRHFLRAFLAALSDEGPISNERI